MHEASNATCPATSQDWTGPPIDRRRHAVQQGKARASSHHPSVRPGQRRQGGTSHRIGVGASAGLGTHPSTDPLSLALCPVLCPVPGQGSSSWCSGDLSKEAKQSSRFATKNALTLHTSSVKTRTRPEFQWVTTQANSQHDGRFTISWFPMYE